MAFHQQRIINLVEESERNLARIADFSCGVRELLVDLRTADRDKLTAIAARIASILDGAERTYLLLERERIKFTRRKNQYARDYMRRRRGTYSPQNERADNLARACTVTLGDGTTMPQAEFDRTVDAQLTAPTNAPRAPESALERELARARELGEIERAKNAERLARDPFASGD